MGALQAIDKEIARYLSHLNTQQKKAVLGVVKTFAQEKADWWEDPEFSAEMEKRFAEMESGTVKPYTLEEAETKARAHLKSRKQKSK